MSSGHGLLKSFRELYSCDARENTVSGYPCLPSAIINLSIIHYVDVVKGISSAGCKRRKNNNFQLMKFENEPKLFDGKLYNLTNKCVN